MLSRTHTFSRSRVLLLVCLSLMIGCSDDDSSSADAATQSDAATQLDAATQSDAASQSDAATQPDGSVASSGCGNGTAPTGLLENQLITVEAKDRSYVLSVPATYDPDHAHPLVFGFHGLNGDGPAARNYLRLENEPAAEPTLFVYPSSEVSADGWFMQADQQDVALFDALLAHLSNTYCVDRDRVFAAGFSHGAMFSNNLTCWRAADLRAIAPFGGSGPWFGGSCTGPMDALIIHGTNDGTVAFTDGESTRDHWLAENGNCTTATQPYGDHCVQYDGCTHPVVFCAFDGGHQVPTFAGTTALDFFLSRP